MDPSIFVLVGICLLVIGGAISHFLGEYRFKKKVSEGLKIKTQRGDSVQSHGEKIIANHLFQNNIRYVYDIPMRLSFFQYKKIRPDFFLPELDIYIEYWGMKGDPNYDRKTEWKTSLYTKYNKKLISLYSYQKDQIPSILDREIKKLSSI